MFARLVATTLVVLAAATSAGAAGQTENLQVFRDVQKQVLQYPHFTIFDSVNAQVDNGTVILSGKVTIPYKKNDIERRVRKLAAEIGTVQARDDASAIQEAIRKYDIADPQQQSRLAAYRWA